MSVEFQEENNMPNRFESQQIGGSRQTPGMVNFLIKKGIVKSEKQASYILFGISAICLISAVIIFYVYVIGLPPKKVKLTPEQQQAGDAFQERARKARENAQNNEFTTTSTQP